MNDSKKTLIAVALITGSLAFAPAVMAAADTETPKDDDAAAPMGSGMATMPMHQQMQRMHKEMEKIHETTDPAERRELMNDHMKSMQGMMQMMHGMMAGDRMMGQGRGGKRMMNEPCPESGAGDRMARMEQRMNAMQMMMDQMLKNQSEQMEKE